jgi:hypothetical protein
MMSTLVRHSHGSYKMLVLNPFAPVGMRRANAATRGGCWMMAVESAIRRTSAR